MEGGRCVTQDIAMTDDPETLGFSGASCARPYANLTRDPIWRSNAFQYHLKVDLRHMIL